MLLEEGQQGVPQDTETALRWHLAAAQQGNALPRGGWVVGGDGHGGLYQMVGWDCMVLMGFLVGVVYIEYSA